MAPTIIFSILQDIFFNHIIKNPQTTIALTFLTHINSGIDGVTTQWVESLLRSIHMIMHAFAVSNEILIIHLSFKVR